MRNLLLLTLILFSCLAYGQNRIKNADVAQQATNYAYDGNENIPVRVANPTVVPYPSRLSLTITVIGTTMYDLQTNASTDDRLVRYGNNELSAVWTMGQNFSAFTDRGTGYNYYDGSNWLPQPTARVENIRTGWPSIAVTASGKEHIISHTSGTDSLVYVHRPTAGSGTWTEERLPPLPTGHFPLWPRLSSGGANGNSLHLLAITTPVANSGMIYQGMDGAIVYSRSQDEGATWDKLYELLPTVDSTYYFAMGADAYAIHANGNTVAIAAGSYLTDWAIWKSTDNGDSWTKTIIHQFPLVAYNPDGNITDINGDMIPDTIPTTDGKVAVMVDDNGMVHTWAGAMRVIDSDGTAGTSTFSFFPGTDALLYWNESMGAVAPDSIAFVLDLDGDGMITLANDGFPAYRGGVTTQASAGQDANGNIYVTYQSLVENTSSGESAPGAGNDFTYRNVYLMASTDGGMTWNDPVNVTNDDFSEGVYPSIPKNVGTNCVDVIWHQDFRPDVAAATNSTQVFDPSNPVFVMHDCIPTSILLGVKEVPQNIADVSVYPNPATDRVKINFNMKEVADLRVEILNTVGQRVMLQEYKVRAPGLHSLDIDVSSLPAGVYFINSISGSQNIAKKLIVR